jgi:hypothetical protein
LLYHVFYIGVVLGYVVYLAIGTFTGELADNTIEFLSYYFPGYAQNFDDMFNTADRRSRMSRQSTNNSRAAASNNKSMFDHTDMGDGSFGGVEASHNSSQASSMEIIGADMALGGGGNALQNNPTPNNRHNFTDFGTAFRTSTIHKDNMDEGKA